MRMLGVKVKKFVVDGSKKGRPKKKMIRSCRKVHVGYRLKKNGCTRPLFRQAWLQKPAHPCSQGKQAGFPGE